ncbi:MAG: flavodoxin-dependent (E)-4-hydroxy-3-methylbut-2-enyl-diphosphate synthase [Nitrospirae bacterium]|uniref:flavodoxin-dependent (E)-4-hydroxy-3-methylbut-2-enyl-diphosphate synthase n=1 Tax=Candidatus Magnetobacterium casense TaxID=1455061 RepID=UPI0009DEFD04|nr:flavodoxin-dependent (E)-4-hydroxy-3-methylbut-2-enyl-diphosphate synthase [Candidatus Magnetobacterium casensis]MBF0338655.1 flavodoxin-dependent (E)-4-hydroxy-3-methylbut-2-enyl-diphosphate synthase [Nitrospirota bacterium]
MITDQSGQERPAAIKKQERPAATKTRQISIGGVAIGGGAPISIQSMTKTDTTDVAATVAQIRELQQSGCELVRLAVIDEDAARCLAAIRAQVDIPLIADIHFDYRLALTVISGGIDALRINPGNIGATWKVKEVVTACKDRGIPIRIGVNAGSLPKDLLQEYGGPTPEAIVRSATRHIDILRELDFALIKVSLKASNVPMTVDAYRQFSVTYDYPLHIGISEAGPPSTGIIKSAVGLGILLAEGIGDTMRVSLTAPPQEEVRVAYEILKSLGLRRRGIDIVSCPTCGRTRVDLMRLVAQAQPRLAAINSNVTVAIMGCEVNGPGEAKEADYGIASGSGMGLLFKKGQLVGRVEEARLIDALIDMVQAG